MLRACCREKNIPMTLPLSQNTVTRFILWLAFDRKVSSATISVYLAGLRQLHIQHNVQHPDIRSEQIKALLQGKKNSEFCATADIHNAKRRPIMTDTMSRLKIGITKSHFVIEDKRMIWSACSILFFGAFRAGEILANDSGKFDPRFTLCANDVTRQHNSLILNIKIPKENKNGHNAEVTLHKCSDTQLCPISAWDKWQAYKPPSEPGQPAFRWLSGLPLTIRQLNAILKDGLHPDNAHFSSHSFRIGAASTLGKLGFSDEDIKTFGRWRSSAYEGYIRRGRNNRRPIAERFSSLV